MVRVRKAQSIFRNANAGIRTGSSIGRSLALRQVSAATRAQPAATLAENAVRFPYLRAFLSFVYKDRAPRMGRSLPLRQVCRRRGYSPLPRFAENAVRFPGARVFRVLSIRRQRKRPHIGFSLGSSIGLEPTTARLTAACSHRLSYVEDHGRLAVDKCIILYTATLVKRFSRIFQANISYPDIVYRYLPRMTSHARLFATVEEPQL